MFSCCVYSKLRMENDKIGAHFVIRKSICGTCAVPEVASPVKYFIVMAAIYRF